MINYHRLADRKNTPAMLKFLESTEIGNKTSEKEMAEKEESRDEIWGWQEERESENEEESGMEYEDREEAQEANDGENLEEDETEGEPREDENVRKKKLVEEMHNVRRYYRVSIKPLNVKELKNQRFGITKRLQIKKEK
jgi:hypothetical protein